MVRRWRRRGAQEVDVVRSKDLEEEGAERGYYIGLIGSILKYGMTMLGGLLVVATQDVPASSGFVFMIVVFYVLGWIFTREAGMKSLTTYDTVLDVLAFGMTFGFLIRVVEGLVLRATTGIVDMDVLSPFEPFQNSALVTSGFLLVVIGLIFASVAEEMLHRGGMIYLFNILTDKEKERNMNEDVAKVISLIVQAVFFALLHAAVFQKPEQIFALFAGGLVFGLVLYYKKDLSVCIVAHLTVNLSALLPYFVAWLIQNPVSAIAIGLVTGLFLMLFTCRGENE